MAAILLALRVALPWAVALALESRWDRWLGGRVVVGDVDLWLLAGRIALEDVVACQAAGPGGAGTGGEPAPCTREAPGRWLSFDRLAVDIDWLPLLHRELHVSALELSAPFAIAVRTGAGNLALPVRWRAGDDAGAPTGPPERWRIVVEQAALRDGHAILRDRLVEPEESLALALAQVDLDRLSLEPAAFEKPARLAVEGRVARAPFSLEAWLDVRSGGDVAVTARLEAEGVPLERAYVHVPELGGFTGMTGAADLSLRYERVPDERERLTGHAAVHGLRARVRGRQEPVLSWDELAIAIDEVDLRARTARLGAVRLSGAVLPVRARPEPGAPVVAPGSEALAQLAADARAPTSTPTREPWTWSIASVRIADSTLRVSAPGAEPLAIALAASAERIDAHQRFPVSLTLRGASGRVTAKGSASLDPPAGALDVSIEALALAPLLETLAPPTPIAIRGGTIGGSLHVERADAGGPLAVSGTLRVDDLRGEARAAPQAFWWTGDAIEASIAASRVPLRDGQPAQVRLDRLMLNAPEAKIVRDERGLVLPGRTAPAQQAPDLAAARAEGRDGEQSGASGDAGASTPPFATVEVGSLEIENGMLHLEDRTVEPFYRKDLTAIDVSLDRVTWPGLRVADLEISLAGLGRRPTTITGSIDADGATLEVDARRVRLPPLNPYVTRYSDYAIERGTLTLDAQAALEDGQYDVDLGLRLHDLALAGADEEFRREFGVPLALGLSLLRDLSGDIVLSVAVEGDLETGARVGLLRAIARSLHRAVLNALVSPLKVLGAVVRRGGEVVGWQPDPIPFAPGSAALTTTGRERLDELASVLAERPGLHVALQAVVVPADRREKGEGGLRKWLSGLVGNDEERKRASRAAALAEARLQAVVDRLTEGLGVPAGRVATRAQPKSGEAGPPRVEVALEPRAG